MNGIDAGTNNSSSSNLSTIELSSSIRNNAPILDLMLVVNHVKDNTSSFQKVLPVASPKKFINQITPDKISLPALGIGIEFGSETDFELNSGIAQKLEIVICCTMVFDTTNDLTGAGSLFQLFDVALRDLLHSIYNWQPSEQRYLNGFSLKSYERIENLSDNSYEVYCAWFSIPCQIDYTDGYLTDGQILSSIQNNITLKKFESLTATVKTRNVSVSNNI